MPSMKMLFRSSLALSSCALFGLAVIAMDDPGAIKTNVFTVPAVSTLNVSDSILTTIRVGAATEVKLSARARDFSSIELNTADGAMSVHRRVTPLASLRNMMDDLLNRAEPVRLYMTTPDLTRITASLGATINLTEQLKSLTTIEVASGAKFIADALSMGELTATATTGGVIELAGAVQQAKLRATSGATINALALAGNIGVLEAEDGATILQTGGEQLAISNSMGATVTLTGAPAS